MRPIYGHNDAVAHLVASLIDGCDRSDFGDCTAIGVAEDERLIGGFVFHNYNPVTGVMEISFAGMSRRWLTREIIYAVFSYLFDQLGCQMAISRTPAGMKHALRMTRSYGFSQVTIPRLFGRNEDGIISTLTEEAWRANGFHKENIHG
jgi:RimJ/RimL family protein N-acetyltransferase